MNKAVLLVIMFLIQVKVPKAQINLSPVNTGDCVAARITAKRTLFVDELNRKACAEHNIDKAKEKQCIENLRSEKEFSFFTDRCSDGNYFIGINGREFKLSRTSKTMSKPNNFIGSFAGNGMLVYIGNARLLKKVYMKGEAKDEMNVEDAAYKVDVTITRDGLKKMFKDVVLWYGR